MYISEIRPLICSKCGSSSNHTYSTPSFKFENGTTETKTFRKCNQCGHEKLESTTTSTSWNSKTPYYQPIVVNKPNEF